MGVLVLLSLALITISFREANGGGLHSVQGAAASVLRPFEVAAERVTRPFRDAAGYLSSLVHARSENRQLHREVDQLRTQVIQNESALQENVDLRRALDYKDSSRFPQDYTGVATRVIANPQSRFDQKIVIAAGADEGVRAQDAVVTPDGLVGQVTRVFSSVSQVTLLTDETSHVAASDLETGAAGIEGAGQGGKSLILDRVPKELTVGRGDSVITAGSPGKGELQSIYPRNIQIGVITSVGQTEVDSYWQIQVEPFVDFSNLHTVIVLVPKSQQ